MSDGSHNKVKLNVRVTPTKKEEWQDALADGQTLTSVVQTAVDKEINNEYVPRQATENLETEVQVDLSEVTSQLTGLQQTVSALQAQIDQLSTPGEEPEEEEISDLAMSLISHIPSFGEFSVEVQQSISESDLDTEYAVRETLQFVSREDPEKFIDGSAYKIAQYTEAEPARVRQALVYLETKTTEDIGSVIVDGTRHWFRGVPA